MIGVGIGALFVNKFSNRNNWYKILIPSLFIMSFFYSLIFFSDYILAPYNYYIIMLSLLVAGIFGGFYLIPLESFIQIRPKKDQKGKVIAASNFISLGGSMISGPVYILFGKIGLKPTHSFLIIAIFTLIIMILLKYFLNLYEKKESRIVNCGLID
jgi:acyl-[acyl-carrier-protein]-phospholipid O-acyltransferase/long-chain-fatty-acid--[acyl-carrier-protein] ligase